MATSLESALGQARLKRGVSAALLRLRFFEPASLLWGALILFLLLQRYFVRGIALTGMGGR